MSAADDLRKRMANAAVQANISLGIALAQKLKLFQAILSAGTEGAPGNYMSIAQYANLKPRYTKELLGLLACGNIIEVAPDGEHFYIPNATAEVFKSDIPEKAMCLNLFIPLHSGVFDKIIQVIKKDGPLGMDYSEYSEFYSFMDQFSTALHKKHLIPDLIPMTGMNEKLENGIEFLDVGCGGGFHVCHLAKHYKNTKFTGIDITPSAISNSEARKQSEKVENVKFFERNAKALDEEWSNRFDMVMIFDACHDQCRPDLCIKEIHRVLKPGGVFAMVEIDGTSSIYDDKKAYGMDATLFYSASVFHCLAVGSNSPDALGMGTMWGVKKGEKLIRDAGFDDVQVLKIPFFEFNVLYLAKKQA